VKNRIEGTGKEGCGGGALERRTEMREQKGEVQGGALGKKGDDVRESLQFIQLCNT